MLFFIVNETCCYKIDGSTTFFLESVLFYFIYLFKSDFYSILKNNISNSRR